MEETAREFVPIGKLGLKDAEMQYLQYLKSKQSRRHHWIDETGHEYATR